MRKRIYVLLFTCVMTLMLNASKFRHLTTLEGLSQNDVNCIFQDSRGFIWIGTNDGLNRYDGYQFKIYRKQPRQKNGLVGNIIQSITEDNEGNLWIGTSDNGVCKFNVTNNQFTSFSNTVENPNLLHTNRIVRVKADQYQNIWVLTHRGLNVIKVTNNKIVTVPFKSITHNNKVAKDGYIKDICADSQGNIWLGTLYGIRKIDPVTYKIEKSFVSGQGARSASKIYERNNKIFVLNTRGVQLFNKKDKVFNFVLEYKGANQFEFDNEGNLWLGTYNGVVYAKRISTDSLRYKVEKVYTSGVEDGSLSKDIIVDLFKDKSGLIWVGTNGGGLNIYNAKKKLFNHYQKSRTASSISYNKIRSICEDEYSGLWIGTDGGGINYRPSNNNSDYSEGFVHIKAGDGRTAGRGYALAEDTINNVMWIGTAYSSKVLAFDTRTGKEINIDKWNLDIKRAVFSAMIDRHGYVWLGTYGGGLWRLKPDGKGGYQQDNFIKQEKSYSLPSDLIRSLLEDRNGNIWVGTADGLAKIKEKHKYNANPKFFTYRNIANEPNSLSHDYILPIFQSSEGDIWIGTLGGGLNRYRETKDGIGYFETLTTDDGLPNNVIKGILQDEEGHLWISSNAGLTKFNVKSNEMTNYDVDDGLQDYEFSELACFKRRNGEMIFGGVNGFNSFFPKQITEDKSLSQVVFTQLDILNQRVEIGEEIHGRSLLTTDLNDTKELQLKYSENSFTVYYAGLHFAAPRKNQYKYMLEGFDEDWITTSSEARFAKYTNLRPGTYQLKVLASNSDGIWGTEPKTIDITVIAPWWLSGYALFIYTVAIVILLLFFRRFSIIGVQQKNQLLMERFEKEKVEELSQMKLRFFTNISHEFRTPLTLIIGPIEKLIKDKSLMSEEKMDNIHNIIHRNATVLLRLINQLMDFRKFEQGKMKLRASQGDIVKFIKDVYASFEVYAEQKKIEFLMSFTSHKIPMYFDAEKLEKVIYNLLSNAFKFTPEGGKISIDVNEDKYMTYITVEDTGVGMDKTMQKHVFERFYQSDKIENKKYGSTGIGLAYSKGLVEMHKGVIDVSSEENKGTKFMVSLLKGKDHFSKKEVDETGIYQPIEDVVWVNTKKTLAHPENKNNETSVDTADKKTLLIVEDNNELRSFIKESLSDEYIVIEAENGEEGLEKCKQDNPDLIVSDVMMPKMDGFEMCKTIKEDVDVSHTPIILLTAKTSSEHRVKGYSLGADAYVSKPFDLEVLKVRIENLLKKREEARKNFSQKVEVTPTEVATTSMDERFLAKILRIIESKIGDSELTVEELASEYGISKVILNRKLKALTGMTAKVFIRSIRIKRAAQLLTTGRYSVADVTYEVGFSDLKYFRTCFKNEIGLSPSDYKREHANDGEENDENEDTK
ncbi:hybrid sensor histidine kinase/response regulator transcription factor [Saccharicrinis sp. 156]|uniref:hybrid sensor histidine kinase/response regulator transcription factor n=1 Tax=Saccharicrinis sp. 156 TaxID=3417574 RepID=UPI003D34B80D